MTDLQERLATQMRLAFFACMREKLASDDKTEAIEWLIPLHQELGKRLAAVLPSKAREIHEHMDNELFAQQLRAGTFGSEQLGPLINYTWELLRMACAPDMDNDVKAAYETVCASLQPGAAFSDVVPLYLDHAHAQLDEIIKRIKELQV